MNVDVIDELAVSLLYLEDLACTEALAQTAQHPAEYRKLVRDYGSFEEAKEHWQECLEHNDEYNWKHHGDCVNAACTCSVCFVEEYRKKAKAEIKKYMKKEG